MKYDYCSDLHIDCGWKDGAYSEKLDWNAIKHPDSDVLLLPGDLANSFEDVKPVLLRARKAYSHVLYCDGNHENWYNDLPIKDSMEAMGKWCDLNGIHYMDGAKNVTVQDVTFLGANFWYDFNIGSPAYTKKEQLDKWLRWSIDPKITWGNLTPEALGDEQIASTMNHLIRLGDDAKVVMMSHVAPCKELLTWKKLPKVIPISCEAREWNLANGSFANSKLLPLLLDPRVKQWVYGHAHSRKTVHLHGTQIMINTRGYPSEARFMGPWKIAQAEI